jgi:tetratricopeptide (TPR) repeat protein
MESLSAQQRKVLDTFARLGHPATPTELAQEVHLPVNQVNAILKRLSDGGFVSLAPQKRRKVSLYLVSERLFRIWCQMRFAPATRKRLEFFIEFIRIWYTQSEWKQEADRLIRDYRDAAVAKGVQAAGRFMDYLDHMVDAAPRPDWGVALEDTAVRVCVETGDCRRAENMLRERLKTETLQGERERAANSWFLLAYVYRSWNKPTQAIEAWEQAVACKSDFHEALNNWGAALRELAGNERGEERERLLQEAIRRYEMALSVKPGSPVVLDNWGNALADLAESKTGNEQGRLLEMASQKVSEAIQLAIARGEQDKVAFYHAHFVRIVLLRCLLAVEREDRGTARELFALALEHSRLGDPESVRRALTEFFQNATREPHVSMCEELFGVMHQKGMVQEAALLLPFAKAVEYWRKGKDEEVLDRLNPEVREIVEAIIRGDRRPSD